MEKGLKSRLFEVGVSVMVMAAVVAPAVMFAKSGDKIYVNEDASGMQDGSSKHPYKTIWQGLDKAEKSDEVIVAKGTYKERITLPKGVKLSGAGKGKTIIKSSERHDDPVINMKDGSKVWGVTVQDGEVGIYVRENAKVEIIEVEVRNNRHDGIVIEKGERTDKEKVSIVKSEIKKNGWSGIYAKKRKVVITESDIQMNKRNGMMLESGVRAWIDDNSVSENMGSGLVANVDGADITVASKNTFRKNGLEGIEARSFGAEGSFIVKKSRISENGHYGVARVSKVANIPASRWNGLVIQSDNNFFGNVTGNTSPIIRGF
jgi:hypothetical protein